jgi:uncharacterized protein YbjQ (UPF0145 family)
MFVVTTDTLPGFDVKEVIGGVVGAIARPLNVYTEGVKALSGGLSPAMPQALSRWREDAMARMAERAYHLGANAVLGMRFDHRQVSSSWTEICAYGTAVFVVPTGGAVVPRATGRVTTNRNAERRAG